MAVFVTVSLSFGHFAGSEHGQRIPPFFFLLRRSWQFGKQVFKTAGMVSGQQDGKVVPSANAPTPSSSFHAVSNQRKDVALHTAKPGVMNLSRRVGFRDLNPALVWI